MSMKNKVARNVCQMMRNVPVVNKALFTFSNMYIDEYRHFSYDAEENGEKDIVRTLAKVGTQNPVFFDVGANVGDWTGFVASQFPEFTAHLFELSRTTYQDLQARYAANGNIKVNNVALSDKAGTIEYVDFGKNDGGNTILLNANYHKKDSRLVQANAMRGDDYCTENGVKHIHFLKIDTEGAEYFVLKGFEEMLKNKAVDIVQFEYGYTHADAKTLMKDFFALFESCGYSVGRLHKGGVTFKSFSYSDNDFKSGPNYVACLPKYKDILQKF